MQTSDDAHRCDWCNAEMQRPYWRNLVKDFCSLECTNAYLTSEGFETINKPTESARVLDDNDRSSPPTP